MGCRRGLPESGAQRDVYKRQVLGYNVHKEPWLWPDSVRIKHGVIAGGTGAGKTTFLENIIAQDLQRRFGDRPMPMIIFDGKGDQEFLERLLPHIEAAGRLQDLRVIDPSNPRESARYNPFYSGDALYQEHVNFIFQSFGDVYKRQVCALGV